MSIRRENYHPEDTEAARQLKRLMNDQLFDARLKVNEAAAKLNVTSERMYKYLNEGSVINNFPAYLLPLWTLRIGSGMQNHLAHEAGYTLIELPKGPADLLDTPKAASRAMKESAEAVSAYLQCAEDGKVSDQEWSAFRREVQEALSSIAGMITRVEEMRRC